MQEEVDQMEHGTWNKEVTSRGNERMPFFFFGPFVWNTRTYFTSILHYEMCTVNILYVVYSLQYICCTLYCIQCGAISILDASVTNL